MITIEQILATTKTDLPRVAGEVLKVNGMHDWPRVSDGFSSQCTNCGFYEDDYRGEQPCGKAKRFKDIPLTPVNAFKWRDWAVKRLSLNRWLKSMIAVYQWEVQMNGESNKAYKWFAYYAQPHHYIRAASICKILSEG